MMPEMIGRKIAGGGGEKSNFAFTCNLLSQFIKERGSIADFVPRSGARPPMTMSLLPGADVTGDPGRSAPRSMELFPQRAGISAAGASASDVREPEKAQQLTIFYGGRVMVFDNFPPEKAKDLMQVASKVSATAASGAGNAAGTVAAATAGAAAKQASVPSHGSPALKSTSNNPPAAAPAQKAHQPAATISYLPIARKASLHRFLEKRKDRINAKAPYQSDPQAVVVKKEEECGGEPWLGLGPQISNPSQSSDCSK